MTRTWSLRDLPDQQGRTFLVTGCTLGGLGYHTALELARGRGAVTLAGRSNDKLAEAERAIVDQVPDASLRRLVVDLSDLSSVRSAAAKVEALDVLVNNAGIMATPYRRTADGFESQFATNHLGPFLLTGLLLPLLRQGRDGRVVTVSSGLHRAARTAPLGDPRATGGRYRRWPAYSASKLANLLFTFELARRLEAAGIPVKALAAHPGTSATRLTANGPTRFLPGPGQAILDAALRAMGQSAADGALPTLMAATDDLPSGTYCGPSGFQESRGNPTVVGTSALARDSEAQSRLWDISEEAVGLAYP